MAWQVYDLLGDKYCESQASNATLRSAAKHEVRPERFSTATLRSAAKHEEVAPAFLGNHAGESGDTLGAAKVREKEADDLAAAGWQGPKWRQLKRKW
jgi:hypothetical protein